jgi:hypothetical protein
MKLFTRVVLLLCVALLVPLTVAHAQSACTGPHQIPLEAGCGCESGFHSDTLDPIDCVANPTPTPEACASTVDGTPTNWVYAIGGGSRSRTVPLLDSGTGADCGSKVETQYPFCVPGEDGSFTNWYSSEGQPEGATQGQCGGGYSTITICFQGKTIEVLNNGEELASYRGYTPGACPTPTDPPSNNNGGGPGDGKSDGRSDGGSSCPSCTAPPPGKVLGSSTGGQVLGASTDKLAATGSNNQFTMRILTATAAALIIFLLGHRLVQDNETS